MSIHLSGNNFQGWENFDLTVDGLTVVVGPSNLGKSALFRALKGLVRNELNANQVRVGSESMEVTATIDGHTIVARRKKKGSISYTVDGEEYAKLGGAIPEAVKDLKLNEIAIGDVKLDPIFAPQFGGQFLIEESPSALNAILGAFSSTERLEAGKREANSRIAEKNAQAKALAVEMRAAEERKEILGALAARATSIQGVVDQIEPIVRKREQTIRLLDELISHKMKLDALKAVIEAVKIPDIQPVINGIELEAAYRQAVTVKARHQRLTRTLKRLFVPDIQPVIDSIELTSAYGRAAAAKEKYQRIRVVLKKLVIPETDTAQTWYETWLSTGRGASAKQKLTLANQAFSQIETIVATWTKIVGICKLGRAYLEAENALEARVASQAQRFQAQFDLHAKELNLALNSISQRQIGIDLLGTLLASRKKQADHRNALFAVEREYAAAQEVLKDAEEAVRHEVARKTGSKCPKCGEVIPLKSNASEDEEEAA